jgi:hypothetical protein
MQRPTAERRQSGDWRTAQLTVAAAAGVTAAVEIALLGLPAMHAAVSADVSFTFNEWLAIRLVAVAVHVAWAVLLWHQRAHWTATVWNLVATVTAVLALSVTNAARVMWLRVGANVFMASGILSVAQLCPLLVYAFHVGRRRASAAS